MQRADIERVRGRFNDRSDCVRVVSLVSPTCLVCQYGAGALRTVFDLGEDSDVIGLVGWIPMMDADDLDAAETEAARLAVPGVEHVWDGEKTLGGAFSKTLGLQSSAWDVYLLYARGVTWTGEVPPAPTFWMHQLQSSKGPTPGLLLNPKTFLEQFLGLLGRGDEATEDLALLSHACALAVVKAEREKDQPSLEDVAAAAST